MTPLQTTRLTELAEARARLLRELTVDLETSRSAYATMDLEGIYRHVAAQSAICEQLHQIERGHSRSTTDNEEPSKLVTGRPEHATCVATGNAALVERLRKALADMALAEGRARQVHRAHALMLEGMRRTFQTMANALMMFSPVYSRPAQAGKASRI